MNLAKLKALFVAAGCSELYAKPLAHNDNSKNQVYFGPGFEALNLFPTEGIRPDGKIGNTTFKAKLDFGWLLEGGGIAPAPHAQLILYPQYPEVRFSGFLRGSDNAPASLMASRQPGRVLYLGTKSSGAVVGWVAPANAEEAVALKFEKDATPIGVFLKLRLPGSIDEGKARSKLILELRRIAALGWVNSKQLDSRGVIGPCDAPQCGGFTLEAEFGIPKNSVAEPDFMGWEIKQHVVSNFNLPASGSAITLMTPEPTSGYYKEKGPEAFVRRYGYADRRGRADRMNFGGIHKVGLRHATTDLMLELQGYEDGEIKDSNGSVALVDKEGVVAAAWGFAGLLTHWARKHRKAAYVPSKCRTEPVRQYSYGPKVRLASGTDSLCLLNAFASGAVYYDPGIKLEQISTKPKTKRRNQFRIGSKNISALYGAVDVVDVNEDG